MGESLTSNTTPGNLLADRFGSACLVSLGPIETSCSDIKTTACTHCALSGKRRNASLKKGLWIGTLGKHNLDHMQQGREPLVVSTQKKDSLLKGATCAPRNIDLIPSVPSCHLLLEVI